MRMSLLWPCVCALAVFGSACGKDPEVAKRLSDLGAVPASCTPEEFVAFVDAEVKKWHSVADRTGMKAEN